MCTNREWTPWWIFTRAPPCDRALSQHYRNPFLTLQLSPPLHSTNYYYSGSWHARLVWPIFGLYMSRIILSVFCVQLLLVTVVVYVVLPIYCSVVFHRGIYHNLCIHSPFLGQVCCRKTTEHKCCEHSYVFILDIHLFGAYHGGTLLGIT